MNNYYFGLIQNMLEHAIFFVGLSNTIIHLKVPIKFKIEIKWFGTPNQCNNFDLTVDESI